MADSWFSPSSAYWVPQLEKEGIDTAKFSSEIKTLHSDSSESEPMYTRTLFAYSAFQDLDEALAAEVLAPMEEGSLPVLEKKPSATEESKTDTSSGHGKVVDIAAGEHFSLVR